MSAGSRRPSAGSSPCLGARRGSCRHTHCERLCPFGLRHCREFISHSRFKRLGGFFNPHECLCPDTITAVVQMTSAGQTDVGSSTIAVSFFLGTDCSSSSTSTSCSALGSQIALTTSQAAQATLSGSQVFQSAAGGTTVDCGTLTAGSTTLWAFLTQDGKALSFSLSQELPVVTTAVAAPTAVTALPSNHGLLVSWTPPADTSQVAGYQVLCLPRPAQASTAAYESCGLDSSGSDSTVMTASDETEVCSAEVSATKTSVRLAGLDNGTSYTVAVISIDLSGGVSPLSPQATAMPQPTFGFFDKYQQEGGMASGCALVPHSGRAGLLWIALAAALVVALGCGPRGKSRRGAAAASITRVLILLLAFSEAASAQISLDYRDADWPQSQASPQPQTLDWGVELGVSLYRPAVDSEFSNCAHPFAETFGSSRHLLSEAEVDPVRVPSFRNLGRGSARRLLQSDRGGLSGRRDAQRGRDRPQPHPVRAVAGVQSRPNSGPQAGAADSVLEGRIGRRGVDGEQHGGQSFPHRVHAGMARRRGRRTRAQLPRIGHHQSRCAGRPLCAVLRMGLRRDQRTGF